MLDYLNRYKDNTEAIFFDKITIDHSFYLNFAVKSLSCMMISLHNKWGEIKLEP
jgi:hypothetical protein